MISALLALSFLIFFHELGHFLVARFFGVKVEVFSIGFGKKLVSKTIGDTEYALSLIPLGGYVKMKGQNDSNPLEQSQDVDSYTSKTPLQRICILLAGPLFNILLAFLIYCGLGYGERQVLLPIVGEVEQGFPAEQAGILSGDKIVAINGHSLRSWNDLVESVLASKALHIQVQRDGKMLDFEVIPTQMQRRNIFGEEQEVNVIGIKASNQIGYAHYGVGEAIYNGLVLTWNNSLLIFEGIKKLIVGVVPTSEVGGVVSIVQVMDKASASGIVSFLALLALISINLGVLNLLPIPALDGGHIVFNLYELVSKKPPSEKVFLYLTLGGWAILFALMSLGLYNDFNRLLQE
ncbi:RIP metalloprotease RseP [Helicobacter enhydrae]|uniref:Zinc metalloprotease n=1 Tax=Helicobacter enhydrae TaxID=222136 RepID=A0A1B1U5I5_9HELI|nr:RIP metalloprotease RseP [Helicobacter enhydrae]ANV97955.1 RIP metalloprotease RseP [Helicobacter enhydrae]